MVAACEAMQPAAASVGFATAAGQTKMQIVPSLARLDEASEAFSRLVREAHPNAR